MAPPRFVGPVGCLAMALGVGADSVSGTGIAWAESSDSGADPNTAASPNIGDEASPRHRGAGRGDATLLNLPVRAAV